MIITYELPPHLQKQVDLGESGTDILHGELKWLMLQAEEQIDMAKEDDHEIDTRYWEGQLDALTHVYQLTYLLAFAIDDRSKNAKI
jgi:hypothetical protein